MCFCGVECPMGTSEEPCWGAVDVVDEVYWDDDSYWVHACEGHKDQAQGLGPYIPKPKEAEDAARQD